MRNIFKRICKTLYTNIAQITIIFEFHSYSVGALQWTETAAAACLPPPSCPPDRRLRRPFIQSFSAYCTVLLILLRHLQQPAGISAAGYRCSTMLSGRAGRQRLVLLLIPDPPGPTASHHNDSSLRCRAWRSDIPTGSQRASFCQIFEGLRLTIPGTLAHAWCKSHQGRGITGTEMLHTLPGSNRFTHRSQKLHSQGRRSD